MKGIFSRLGWFIPVRKWRDTFREFFNPLDQYLIRKYTKIYVKHKYKNYIIMFPPPGLGEIVFFGIYMKEFKDKNSKKVLFLTFKEAQYLMVKDILCYVDEVLMVEYNLCSYFTRDSNFSYFKQPFFSKKNGRYIRKSLKEYTLNCLDLLLDAKPSILHIVASEKIAEIFNSYNVKKGKTIFIAPYAKSFSGMFDDSRWKEVADELTKKEFDVVFNSELDDFYGYKTLFLSVKETLEFILLCDNFIGYRSGFCDVVASHLKNTKSFIFYPILENSGRTRNTFEYFNLSSNFDNKNTKEVIYTDFESLKNDIINYF